MMLYSRVATIRDKQIEENKLLEQEYLDGQKRLEMMMEIERLKDLREQHWREERRVIARHQGALRVVEQIKERDLERIKQDEIRQMEKAQLMRNIEEMKAVEVRRQIEKQERVKKMLLEVEAVNKESIKLKQKKREEEQAMELEIAQYNLQKI